MRTVPLTSLFCALTLLVWQQGVQAAGAGFNASSCTYNGIPLHGKVRVVTSFPDIKVRVVSAFANLEVKTVDHFASSCGEWTFVTAFPDFTIQYVDSFSDIDIRFVTAFPGANR